MTPDQEEQVARALAETARHEPVPPLPDHVVTRLDDVLAELVTARTDSSGTDATRPGVPQLDARRRRRSNRLVAAAAVALIVAAGGVVAVRDGIGINPASDESASSSAESGGSGQLDTGEAAAPDTSSRDSSAAKAAPPRLRSSALAQDVRRLLADPAAVQDRALIRRKGLTGPPYAAGGCAVPSPGPGEQLLAVRLDGRPATLLLGPVTEDTRSARVYSCRAAKPLAGATVRLP